MMGLKRIVVWMLVVSSNFLNSAGAVELPPPSAISPLYSSGLIASARSAPFPMMKDTLKEDDRTFILRDGTKIGALFLQKQNPNPVPLLIVNFGALADRRFNTSRSFVKSIFESGSINANVLIVDSISSARFYVDNGNLSLGGYDEGRVLLNLAYLLRTTSSVPFTTIHLVGVSLGGLAVMQTLLEDERLHTHLISSAISFSGVVDEEADTQVVLNTFGHRLAGSPDAKMSASGAGLLLATIPHFNQVLNQNGVTNFSLPYPGMAVSLLTDVFHSDVNWFSIGNQLYDAFSNRLKWLAKSPCTINCWDPSIRTSSVEDYVHDSSQFLKNNFWNIHVPLRLIHASDDPVVPFSEFDRVAKMLAQNPLISTIATQDGGHDGFQAVYGAQWISDQITQMIAAGH